MTDFYKGEPTRTRWLDFTTIDEFWDWLLAVTKKKSSTWVFAHNLAYDLTILDFWNWMEKTYGAPRFAVCSDPPTIIHLSDGVRGLLFLDSLNYFRSSLAVLGQSVGLEKGVFPDGSAPDGVLRDYCRRDTEILTKAILGLFACLKVHGLGAPAYTVAGCAFNAYRRRFMQSKIRIHDVHDALVLERGAYYGGRCECFYIGQVAGPVYALDINSLYPHIMSTTKLPCNLLRLVSSPSVESLRDLDPSLEAVAHVRLATESDEFPTRTDRGILYAVGRFDTFLCGEELRRALRTGSVEKVHVAAIYQTADLFSDYVNYFYNLRSKYRAAGDFAYDTFCKLLLNSLAGKWAQRGSEWVDLPDEQPARRWGQFAWASSKTGEVKVCRSIAGLLQQKVERGEWQYSFPAISACINAAAREYMRDFRQLAGLRDCYYMDTDSLHVSEVGHERLLHANVVCDQSIGRFKRVHIGDFAFYSDVKRYTVGVHSVCAGKSSKFWTVGDNLVMQETWPKLPVLLSQPPASTYAVQLVRFRLHSSYSKGAIGRDGYTHPFYLDEREKQEATSRPRGMSDLSPAALGLGARRRKKERDWEEAYRLCGLPIPSEVAPPEGDAEASEE